MKGGFQLPATRRVDELIAPAGGTYEVPEAKVDAFVICVKMGIATSC